MSAAKIPDAFVPIARTDADWSFDIAFEGEDWTGLGVSVVFARQGLPAQGFEVTVGDGVATPTEDLAVPLRIPASVWEYKTPGRWSAEVRRLDGEAIDDAAVFNLRLERGLSQDLADASSAEPAEGDGSVVTGGAIVNRAGRVQVVRAAGGAGPPGPAGSVVRHVHTQSAPSAEWIVNHNLGARPAVTVLSVGGVEVEALTVHSTVNQARVFFAAPTSGTAQCV